MTALLAALAPPEWHRRAACRGKGPDLFYSPDPDDQEAAKALCGDCPVAEVCRDAGRREHGVWGGQTAEERNGRPVAGRWPVRACATCGEPFRPATFNARYCSTCRTDQATGAWDRNRACKECTRPFWASNRSVLYCGDSCRRKAAAKAAERSRRSA